MPITQIKKIELWLSQLNNQNTRGMLLLSQSQNLIKKLKLIYQSKPLKVLTVKDHSTSKETIKNLGSEFDIIFFDAQTFFNCNLFAAVCGSLTGGGILCLNLPDKVSVVLDEIIERQKNYAKDITQIIDHLLTLDISPILKRIIQFSLLNKNLSIISKNNYFFPDFYTLNKKNILQDFSQQKNLINNIIRVAKGHAKRPLVILSNRGRGKSSALGIAASEILKKENTTIIVTAPNIQNLSSFFKHFTPNLNNKKNITFNNNSSLNFIPVDKIVKDLPKSSILLIDEAAAIPVFQLKIIIEKYNRIVFATTNDGYEGNGKGFEIRFKKKLLEKFPQTKFMTLDQPMRWAKNDELELSYFKALMLDAQLKKININLPIKTGKLNFKILDKKELELNQNLLEQVFALLINAHYQTRPADLEKILSDNNLLITVLLYDDLSVVGVALINIEGALKKSMTHQLYEGNKRIKGELLPQSIVLNYGIEKIAQLKFYRIMRIATHPDFQSKGIGSQLIYHIQKLAIKNHIDFIGASFAIEYSVVNFWVKNDYSIIHFGSAKDSSSGAFTCEILKPINHSSQCYLDSLKTKLIDSFFYKLYGSLNELDNNVIELLLTSQFKNLTNIQLTQEEKYEIYLFAKAKRSYIAVEWLLAKFLKKKLIFYSDKNKLLPEINSFLIDLIFKQKSFQQVSYTYQLTGKKQILCKLREIIFKLI